MSSDYIGAAKKYRCECCEYYRPLAQTHEGACPINSASIVKSASAVWREVVRRLRERASLHSNSAGAHGQVDPNGWCETVDCPTEECFCNGLSQGIDLRDGGVESPEQIGRAERH
eukprot:6642875-Pyramimonas_sp.AAC.1